MIIDSTPGSITYQSIDGKKIIFYGEWTLEPKFYLSASPTTYCHLNTEEKKRLLPEEIQLYLQDFLEDARQKGWEIVIDDELSSNSTPK